MKKNVFIHIGFPKCMSTALQRGFFEKHPSISFGGIGVNDNISYVNRNIEELFEILLKYSSSPYYLKRFQDVRNSVSKFLENSKGLPLFSNENLSMNFSLQGLPSLIKYERLLQVFENYNLKIILAKRKPIEIVRGIYKEYVRMGYDQSYEEYLKWLIILRDRNFLSDLAFESKNKELIQYFGEKNILWIDYNLHSDPAKKEKYITKIICDYMGIEFSDDFIINKTNTSLSPSEIEQLVEINKLNKREMGLRMTEPFERHRSKIVFESLIEEKEIFSNVLEKRKAIAQLKNNIVLHKQNSKAQIRSFEKNVSEIIEEYNTF